MKRMLNQAISVLSYGALVVVVFAGVVSIIGTGGSSSNSAKSGVFLDSPVQGLSYTTPTLTGTTGPDGTFRYKSGETVSFYVGELFLGEAPGQAEITPVDIVSGAAGTTDPAVINISRLLQTLDADGDNNNGIQISQETEAIVSAAGSVNFDQSPSDFGSDSVVTGLIAELNAEQVFTDSNPLARTLKPADQAQEQLAASLSERINTTTSYGVVRGYGPTEDTWQWLGVPYAKPPVGDLRWRPPQPPEPWDGVREATAWADQAASVPAYVGFGEGKMSEDCLYLNITAPRNAENLPVMVWFHGGGFRILTANTLAYNNPESLPSKDVILVTVNHRLGPLGYFAHPALSEESGYGGSGNYGQMDLVAALKWVKENIAAFGGNPDSVTIFGQSGGGGKVHHMLASPLASGLFHKAIPQSSRYTCPTVQRSLDEAEEIGLALAEALGIDGEDNVLEAMREISWVDIEMAARALPEALPNVDGYYLPETMREIFESGLQNDVPVIESVTQADNAHNIEVFPREVPWIADSFESDYYAMVFSHAMTGWAAEGCMPYHGVELVYLFNSPASAYVHHALGLTGLPSPPPPLGWAQADAQLADDIMTMWTNFARDGNPSIPGKIEWTPTTYVGEEYLEVQQGGTLEMKSGLENAFPRTGVFIDSPVSGLNYTTPRLTGGLTDESGTFRYMIDEEVSFSLGGIELGTSQGNGVITPVDLVAGGNTDHQAVINIARLIQTLDADGDNNNGIQITSAIRETIASKQRFILFDQSAASFGDDSEVKGLIDELNDAGVYTDGNPRPRFLKPAVEARDHLKATLSDRVIVETTHGTLRGYGPTEHTWQWLGIPYAKPPLGDLRWKPTQPLEPWTGIREATAWGNQAPQAEYLRTYLDGRGAISEDCLTLNITASRDAENQPVMVWFHGGGFGILTAHTPLYNNPEGLPGKGVVQVSVNHRLGPFGYLAHPLLAEESEYGGSGNYGQMDLVMALEWIQDNIASFGGDPDNVTIFGQSGGGGKVVTLMASPSAVGLFHKAISMAGQYVPDPDTTAEMSTAIAEAVGEALFDRIGVASLEEAREVPWTDIIQADTDHGINYGVYRPTVDNYYLAKTMYDTIVDGQPSDVPFMSGATSHDNPHLITGLIESMPFRAEHAAADQFAYRFSRGEAEIVHGAELQYLFNYPSHLYTPGQQPWWTAEDWDVADAMSDMWTNFAKTGDPSIPGFVWPAFTISNDTYAHIDATLEVKTGLAEAWD